MARDVRLGWWKVVTLLAGGAIGVMTLMAFVLAPVNTAGPCTVVAGPTKLPEIPEASGLAISRRTPGVIWSHNDSGNPEVLFALDARGNVRGRVRVPIRLRDWEDVSAARCESGPCLYIADIGDNGFTRRRIEIVRVSEPAPGEAQTAPPFIPIIIGEGGQDWPAVAAGTTLFLIPIVVFTVLLRRHLLRGITFGALRR